MLQLSINPNFYNLIMPPKNIIGWYNKFAKVYAKRVANSAPIEALNQFTQHIEPGGLILDAGCGSGRDSRLLTERRFNVIGVDLSEELLKIAQQTNPKTQFICADIKELPFKDNYFDGVWCSAVLLHLETIEDVKKALKEMYRVLKPGGIIFIGVKKQLGKNKTEYVKDKDTREPRFFRYFTKKEIEDLLKEVGFRVLGITKRPSKSRKTVVWLQVFGEKPL